MGGWGEREVSNEIRGDSEKVRVMEGFRRFSKDFGGLRFYVFFKFFIEVVVKVFND